MSKRFMCGKKSKGSNPKEIPKSTSTKVKIKNYLVDVGIHTYNQGEFISELLDSILNQTYQNFNINICIDGSTDNTLEIVKSYARKDKRIHYVYQANQGISAAINRCIEMGSGDLICNIPS